MSSNANDSGKVTLGSLTVNRLGFGAMRITGQGIWGPPKDHDESIRVLKRAVELGIDFIDTADAYGPEVSENLIAEALYPYKDIVIATKGGLIRKGPGIWESDGRPEHLREALEGSLKRLKVDAIDVYQFHRPDSNVPFEDSVNTLVELKKQGKIKNIGLSNVNLDQLKKAREITEIVSVQNRYNVADNKDSEEVLNYCSENKIAFIPYFPIGGNNSDLSSLEEVAKKHEVTVHQIALAWLLNKSPVMLPIPGTSSVKHLEENVAAVDIKLDEQDLKLLGN
jgi:aryl-alcohol dehydrogenase-like predicted oxidoreductase